MEVKQQVQDDVIIKAFLEAELGNARHTDKTERAARVLRGAPPIDDILSKPELAAFRRELMEEWRGWQHDRYLFHKFPREVSWHEIDFAWEDMPRVQYILYSFWNELSEGTRSPLKAAEAISRGKEIFWQSNEPREQIAAAALRDAYFPPVILAKDPDYDELTILEGHNRMTGFALAGHIPKGQKFYIGIGKGIKEWADWDKS